MKNNPIKRSKFLVELSRDHHSGLLFCWKIKAGLSKHIALPRILNYINFYWERHLKAHFREEETLLFNSGTDPLCWLGKEEHRMLEERIKRLNTDEHETGDEYNLFAELLTKHIRFEERTLFPYLETALPAKVLTQVGNFLAAQHTASFEEDYPDQFWLKTKDDLHGRGTK